MRKTVYPDRSQAAKEVFQVNASKDILVVPIDYAKENHTAQICSGSGEYLLKHALEIHNSQEGAAYLQKRIEESREKYHIS